MTVPIAKMVRRLMALVGMEAMDHEVTESGHEGQQHSGEHDYSRETHVPGIVVSRRFCKLVISLADVARRLLLRVDHDLECAFLMASSQS